MSDKNLSLDAALPNDDRAPWQSFVFVSEPIASPSEPATAMAHGVGDGQASVFALATTQVGDRVRIVALQCGDANARLMSMGFLPGTELEIISHIASGSVIVAWNDHRIGLGADMARHIQVTAVESLIQPPQSHRRTPMSATPPTTALKLREAALGTRLRVMGYGPGSRDYKRKLLAMGLTPKTEFTVTRHAPLGDPTEIEVRGMRLSLRKGEADALLVERISTEV